MSYDFLESALLGAIDDPRENPAPGPHYSSRDPVFASADVWGPLNNNIANMGLTHSKNESQNGSEKNPRRIAGHARYNQQQQQQQQQQQAAGGEAKWDSLMDDTPQGGGTPMDLSSPPKPSEKPRTKPAKSDVFTEEELCGRYEFVRYLGRGSYGHVCEAKSIRTGDRVAIKKIVNVFENSQEAKRILREVRILRELNDFEYISDVIDILPPKDLEHFSNLSIVFEFVDTDLSKIIDWTDQFFSTQHVQYFIWQLLVGLKYIHSSNIVHRDLKPANILINEDCSLRICDFGLSRGLKSKSNHARMPTPHDINKKITISNRPAMVRPLTRHVVTRYYRAPEVLLRANYSTPVDMWSVGCITAELLNMIKENCPARNLRKPLFPGLYSTFSPPHDPYDHKPSKDQLNTIFSVIGTPDRDEIERLEVSDRTKRYLKDLPSKPCIDYGRRFPSSKGQVFMWQFFSDGKWKQFSPKESNELEDEYIKYGRKSQDSIDVTHEDMKGTIDFRKMTLTFDGKRLQIKRINSALDFLNGLLQFDPEKRLTVDEALAHPFLRAYHDESVEKAHPTVEFEFEDVALTSKDIRQLLIKEVFFHNPELVKEYPEYAGDLPAR